MDWGEKIRQRRGRYINQVLDSSLVDSLLATPCPGLMYLVMDSIFARTNLELSGPQTCIYEAPSGFSNAVGRGEVILLVVGWHGAVGD